MSLGEHGEVDVSITVLLWGEENSVLVTGLVNGDISRSLLCARRYKELCRDGITDGSIRKTEKRHDLVGTCQQRVGYRHVGSTRQCEHGGVILNVVVFICRRGHAIESCYQCGALCRELRVVPDNTAIAHRYHQIWQLIAAITAFWPLLIVALYWIRLLGRYISALSQAARRINNGDLYTEVSVPPHASQEIISLAENMDEMRESFLDRLSKEKERSRSNQELITVMSHDIRTPLTTLIGYAEIMDKSPDLPEEERQQYSSIIYQRALRLKELTDEMFYYFLVYGSSDIQVDLGYYNAQVLIPQLLNDRLSAFQDLDVDFHTEGIYYPFAVHTDISLLNRVFENIFSNIRKYGDLTYPISIRAERKEYDFIHVYIRNRIRNDSHDVESTQIGTKTCSKLMALLDGSFIVRSDAEYYTAEVLIPISHTPPSIDK